MRRILAALLVSVSVLSATACSGGSRSYGSSTAAPAYAPQPSTTYSAPAPTYSAPAPTYPAPAPTYTTVAPASAPGGPIPWDAQNATLDQAIAGGRAAGKPVVLYILASWCGY